MERTGRLILAAAFLFLSGIAGAQEPAAPAPGIPEGAPAQMEEGDMPGPGVHGMMGPRGPRQGMGPGMRQKPSPEEEKMHAKRNSIMAIAEAHKELANIYEQQNKIDEAAAELKKIIALTSEELGKKADDPGIRNQIMKKIIPVYHEIARLYLKNNRNADAEKVINEGITLFEKDNPQAATKLILHLGEIYKKNNDMKKAEETFKRVIELNQKNVQ
jgi:F0F1-type ATP synthase delta subunit